MYMQTLLAVIDDLYHFARASLFGVRSPYYLQQENLVDGMQKNLPLLETPSYPTLLSPVGLTNTPHASGALYFIGHREVFLHTDPVVAFDVVLCSIPYGEQVRLQKLGGRWAYVQWKSQEGWVFKDALRDQAKDIFPTFVEGVLYDAVHEETRKLRLCIDDAFFGGAASLLITDAEYVTYKLYKKNLFLPWGEERPRTPGTWQKKLRGRPGVFIGIAPKTNAVMEYIVDDIGYVAFVEAVFPDESISMSGFSLSQEGYYSEAILSLEQWRELRPVYISVN